MKKILSLVLSLVFVLLALVSCGSEELTPMPDHYPTDVGLETYDVVVDLYVIAGEGMSKTASDNVASMLSKRMFAKHNVELNVIYLSETEYQNTVLSADFPREYTETVKNFDGEYVTVTRKAGTVVLVPGESFLASLRSSTGAKPLDLTSKLASLEFGYLNTVPGAKALFDAAKSDDGLYAIPNNHIIGEYTYLLINEEIAQQCLFGPATVASYKSYESTLELRQAIEAKNLNPDDYVKEVKGNFDDKAMYEAAGYVCNVIANPTITTAEALSSAFAVIDSGDDKVNTAAMKVIYALNTDAEIRNMLQFGIEFTHYNVVDDNVVRETSGDIYNMNPLYTGSLFIMSYCEEYGWNETYAKMGENQNKDAVFAG